MKTTITFALILCIFALTACSPAVSSVNNPVRVEPKIVHYVPYVRAYLDGELFKVTKHLEGCHKVDIVIATIRDGILHISRVSPDGEVVNHFEGKWRWDSARILESGNYLLGVVSERIVEVSPEGKVVWELDMPGLCHQTVPLENGNLLVGLSRLDGFMEVKRSGEVVFEWYAKDHIEAYDPTNFRGLEMIHREHSDFNFYCRYAWHKCWPEWTHLNFAQKLPSGNYIASLRNQDLVIEVDGTSGEIVWSWGPGIIKHQHTPIVYDNYMYVFDNGNGRVIKVNRNTGRIVLDIRGILAPTFGDVRRLPNGNLLITDSWHNRAFEINEETGKVVWEIQACSSLYRVWAEETW